MSFSSDITWCVLFVSRRFFHSAFLLQTFYSRIYYFVDGVINIPEKIFSTISFYKNFYVRWRYVVYGDSIKFCILATMIVICKEREMMRQVIQIPQVLSKIDPSVPVTRQDGKSIDLSNS